MKHQLILELRATNDFLMRSVDCFAEEDSQYAPQSEMLTVAQHIAHAAYTVEWFLEGMVRDSGFDLDFESHWEGPKRCNSIAEAKSWFSKSIEQAVKSIEAMPKEELFMPIAAGPVMGGQPRYAVVTAIADHSAHHRGALTVYARLKGYTPSMPYMDAP